MVGDEERRAARRQPLRVAHVRARDDQQERPHDEREEEALERQFSERASEKAYQRKWKKSGAV